LIQLYPDGPKFSIPLDRAIRRIRQLRNNTGCNLPFNFTAPEYFEYGQYAGIWQVSAQRYLRLATPYALGASILTARLTGDAVKRMLNQ
jgi:hypothetical protein